MSSRTLFSLCLCFCLLSFILSLKNVDDVEFIGRFSFLENKSCAVSDVDKRDCGFAGIDETQCLANGCCWAPAGQNSQTPWCYSAGSPISTQKADWSNSGIKFNLVSNESYIKVALNFNNCANEYCQYFIIAHVNCEEYKKYEINSTVSSISIQLGSSQPGQTYEISFTKVTEVLNAPMELADLVVEGATFVPKSEFTSKCPKPYKLLVLGDSVSVAYGIDGVSPCTFSASTENIVNGYVTLVANSVGAELHVVGWSGKGVVRNYGDVNQMSIDPLPALYNRTLGAQSAPPSSANYWDPSRYVPDVVLVLLGSNDYSTQPNPSDEQFVNGLVSFLTQVKYDYLKAKVAAMCSPSAHGPQCANILTATQKTDSGYLFLDPSLYSGGYGCDYHPNAVSQANMAAVITPFVKGLLL